MKRRSFLKGVSSAPLAVAVGPSVLAEEHFLDGTIADVHFAMRRGIGGGRAYWYYTGTMFGKIEGEKAIPLTGMEGISLTQSTDIGSSGWRNQTIESGYFIGLDSELPLDTWYNPLNGKDVEPQSYRSTKNYTCTQQGVIRSPSNLPSSTLDYSGEISEYRFFGGRVWSSEDIRVKIKDSASPTTLTRLKTYSASLEQMREPKTNFVDCQIDYQTMGSWRD